MHTAGLLKYNLVFEKSQTIKLNFRFEKQYWQNRWSCPLPVMNIREENCDTCHSLAKAILDLEIFYWTSAYYTGASIVYSMCVLNYVFVHYKLGHAPGLEEKLGVLKSGG